MRFADDVFLVVCILNGHVLKLINERGRLNGISHAKKTKRLQRKATKAPENENRQNTIRKHENLSSLCLFLPIVSLEMHNT